MIRGQLRCICMGVSRQLVDEVDLKYIILSQVLAFVYARACIKRTIVTFFLTTNVAELYTEVIYCWLVHG
jgi:hypothetical protein